MHAVVLPLFLALSSPLLAHDYCILGAGPGGLQMAKFLDEAGRDYVLFERSQGPGSFFHRFPRHRKLISINKRFTGRKNKEFNLRHDWNSLLSQEELHRFFHFSGDFFPHADDMVRYLQYFSSALNVRYGREIRKVRMKSDPEAWHGQYFLLEDQTQQEYKCNVLLVATGLSLAHKLKFPGEEYAEGYESVSTDPSNFTGQNVLILGRGNSAFETAENILGSTNFIHMIGRSRVRLSWATHYVGDLRAVNDGLLDTYQLKSLDGLLEGDLSDLALIRDDFGKLYVTHKQYLERDTNSASNESPRTVKPASMLLQDALDNFAAREPYDRVICCLGWKFDFSIFDKSVKLKPYSGLKRKYPLLKSNYEAKHSQGLFVVGTASHGIDFRKSAGGFIHGFRYTARTIHRMMENRYHNIPWPSARYSVSQLLNVLLKRINEASGLYQMFEFLVDVVLLGLDSSTFEYLEEVPVGTIPTIDKTTGRTVHDSGIFILNMEYGKNFSGPDKDVFHYTRAIGDAQAAWRSNFLHPVIYHYRQLPSEQQMELRPKGWPLPRPDHIHHVVEDFLTDWTGPNSHVLPLRRFLENCLQKDFRTFYADSCFEFSLTHQNLPIFCQHAYLQNQGLKRKDDLKNSTNHPGFATERKVQVDTSCIQNSGKDEL